MTHALASSVSVLGWGSGGVTRVERHRSGKLDKRGKSVHVNTCSIHFGAIHVYMRVCVLVCVAPPMVVGAWSMAGELRQIFEYYYFLKN